MDNGTCPIEHCPNNPGRPPAPGEPDLRQKFLRGKYCFRMQQSGDWDDREDEADKAAKLPVEQAKITDDNTRATKIVKIILERKGLFIFTRIFRIFIIYDYSKTA